MVRRRLPRWLVVSVALLGGCGKLADEWFCDAEGCTWSDREWTLVTSLSNPGAAPPDPSNRFWNDDAAAKLGQAFFFDPAFSGNATQVDAIKRPSPPARAAVDQPIKISCATCHDPQHAGVDTTSVPGNVSVGAGWTDVNALPVVNSAYRNVVFWNGRADSLWALNVAVAESATTMNGNRLRTVRQIVNRYRNEYQAVLDPNVDVALLMGLPAEGKPGADPACVDRNDKADAFDCLSDDVQKPAVNTVLVNWSKAIAAYEYKLVSGDTPFDRFVREGPASTAISAAAKRGARLFVGKGACIDCHAGPQMTDEQFHDIAVPQVGMTVPTLEDCPDGGVCDCEPGTPEAPSSTACAPWGAYDGLQKLATNKWRRDSVWSDDRSDASRAAYVATGMAPGADLKGAWRTPSLRNVALTGPYMHDGVFATLEEVIWHYNGGGQTAGGERIGVKAPQLKPLMLTDAEVANLVAFLEALTGEAPPRAWTAAPPLPPVLP